MTAPARAGRIVFGLLAGAMALAIVLQDFGDALPAGLFNQGRGLLRMASLLCLTAALGALVVFGFELWRGGATPLGGAICGALTALLLLEVLLTAIDLTLVSRGSHAPLGGPYRELRSDAGGFVWVKKGHDGSKLGFRTDSPPPKIADVPRILFLGDSYTEGSGASPACNYPEVATAEVAKRLDRPVTLLNAGVAGYGPVDAARLLRHLLAAGYHFDAVVLGLFLENDFTDDLPGTERRVVAGVNFRFPRSEFLRRFHPINWRLARYVLFVGRTARLTTSRPAAAFRSEGSCSLTSEPRGEAPPALRALVRRRFEANYGPAAYADGSELHRALDEIHATTRAAGIPLVQVVFPDRILVDRDLAREVGLPLEAADTGRLLREVRELPLPRIEVAPALAAGAENYRKSDTHLSDLGNVRAGRWVGARLAHLLAAIPPFGGASKQALGATTSPPGGEGGHPPGPPAEPRDPGAS